MSNIFFMLCAGISLMVETDWSFLVKQKTFPYLSKHLCSVQGEYFETSVSTTSLVFWCPLWYCRVFIFLCETCVCWRTAFVDCRLYFSDALKIVFMEVIPIFYFSVYGWINLLQLLGSSLAEINRSCDISLAWLFHHRSQLHEWNNSLLKLCVVKRSFLSSGFAESRARLQPGEWCKAQHLLHWSRTYGELSAEPASPLWQPWLPPVSTVK